MTRRVGTRELQENLAALLRRVRNGETIVVTDDDEPVAVIAPPAWSRIDQLIAAGLATPAQGRIDLSNEPGP